MAAVQFREMEKRRNAIARVQSNIRAFCFLKDWEWMKIMFKIKPLISQAEEGKKMEELEKKYNDVKAQLAKEKKRRQVFSIFHFTYLDICEFSSIIIVLGT